MRLKHLLMAVIATLTFGLAAEGPAAAFLDRPDQPANWDRIPTVRHWVYHPRYRHIYLHSSATDPYEYQYIPRGYYPYYNTAYWRTHYRVHRAHNVLPPYYKAWGAERRNYHHVEWHRMHYGGHWRGDW